MVEHSIQREGFGRSILLANDGTIIAGNATVEAAASAGLEDMIIVESDGTKVIAVKRMDVDPGSERFHNLAIGDNRTAELASWDTDILKLLADEGAIDPADYFYDDELDKLLASLAEPPALLTDPDDVPPLPSEPITKPGDVIHLGAHVLMCGDSTVPTDIDRLADGDQFDLLVTDPPYGVEYVGKTRAALTIKNDRLGDEGTRALVRDALTIAPLKAGAAFYVCSPAGNTETAFRLAIADANLQLRQCLVWVKQQFVMGRRDYHWRHESILYGWKAGAAHYFAGGRKQDTVIDHEANLDTLTMDELIALVRFYQAQEPDTIWREDRPHSSQDHPTIKPVALLARAVKNSSKPNDLVLDLFGGSGSTLIACEQTGRRCAMMELDAKYCDVIVTRWQNATGQTATRDQSDLTLAAD